MELGHYQLQIGVSVVLILAAAIVALICDFLKGNNEQLRELTIELSTRRELEQVAPRVAERPVVREVQATADLAVPVVSAAAASAVAKMPVAREHAVSKEKKRAVNASAMAAMERGAAWAGTGKRPRSVAVPAPPIVAESVPEVVVKEQVMVQQPAVKSVPKKDWGSLLSRNAAPKAQQKTANQDLLAAVVAATDTSVSAKAAETSLPTGFRDGQILNQLLHSRQPISGLVVSIGVNASRNADGSLPDAVIKLVQSLIGPTDFAAQSSEEEFLLIYPQERGASAQRRLSQIAQQLWDFQLRSLGSFQILFSWGGVEVRSESMEEAIASASERMQETKRGRKLLTMASPAAPVEAVPLRQAV